MPETAEQAKKDAEPAMADEMSETAEQAKKDAEPAMADEMSETAEKAMMIETGAQKAGKEPNQVDMIAARAEWMDIWKTCHQGSGFSAKEMQKRANDAWKTSSERQYLVSCYTEAEKKRWRL